MVEVDDVNITENWKSASVVRCTETVRIHVKSFLKYRSGYGTTAGGGSRDMSGMYHMFGQELFWSVNNSCGKIDRRHPQRQQF
jgi:hypothetical protein